MDKKLVLDNWCFKCGNKGFPDKECPSCHRAPTSTTLNLDHSSSEQIAEFVEKIDAFGIPSQYRGVIWDAEVLRKSFKGKEQNMLFQKYVNQLDKVNACFVSGVLSPKSAIIIAPAGYSKMTFAYSCMQRALDAGFSVAPFLDTIELKRVLFLAGEMPNYKIFGKVSYDDYIMSDVCFVTVTKMKQHEWAYETIQELLDRRSRKGLSTFIISRFDLSELSKRDYSNQFDVLSTAISEDTYKYPAIIRFREV